MSEADNRTFTSWKLDILNAMSIDPRITASDFRVAFRLMQHVNAKTGACFPSQDSLSEEAVMKERSVRQCIANLRRHGWIDVTARSSGGRGKSNLYRFLQKHVNAMLDRMCELQEARRERRTAGALTIDYRHVDAGEKVTTGISTTVPTGMEMPPNTYIEHPQESQAKRGDTTLRRKENSYSRAKEGRVA